MQYCNVTERECTDTGITSKSERNVELLFLIHLFLKYSRAVGPTVGSNVKFVVVHQNV